MYIIVSPGFNPCFRGRCSGRHSSIILLRNWGVSILVFVEDALEDAGGCILSLLLAGFNPCFRGRCSGSILNSIVLMDLFVSILVFVEDALEGILQLYSSETGEFQSLFSWKMLWKAFFNYTPQKLGSFNPCFRGRCSGRQALIDFAEFIGSFNPCFRGRCSGSLPKVSS